MQYPSWDTLHLCVDSPSKTDLQILPLLNSVCDEFEVRTAPKKVVMKEIAAAKKAGAPK